MTSCCMLTYQQLTRTRGQRWCAATPANPSTCGSSSESCSSSRTTTAAASAGLTRRKVSPDSVDAVTHACWLSLCTFIVRLSLTLLGLQMYYRCTIGGLFWTKVNDDACWLSVLRGKWLGVEWAGHLWARNMLIDAAIIEFSISAPFATGKNKLTSVDWFLFLSFFFNGIHTFLWKQFYLTPYNSIRTYVVTPAFKKWKIYSMAVWWTFWTHLVNWGIATLIVYACIYISFFRSWTSYFYLGKEHKSILFQDVNIYILNNHP